MSTPSPLSDPLTKLAYQALQQTKSVFGLTHKTLSSRVLNAIAPMGIIAPRRDSAAKPLSPELFAKVKQRVDQLQAIDWQDAEEGIYPKELLFDHPWGDFLRFYPLVCLDSVQIWNRANQQQFQDFSPSVDTSGYPQYYVRNFHHQTDGYFSDFSANVYDLQVELLFNGSADAMRRRILAPLRTSLQAFSDVAPKAVKILDVACGTGRTLRMMRGMLPQASLYGTDLSPAYLRKANQLLSELPGELPQLTQSNAEELPYVENYFHAVTCVFLFHELPAPVRQKVIEQCFRVVKPGGSLIICDSIQMNDSPELVPVMENFAENFHEPFYRNYIQDDFSDRLCNAGFVDITEQVHFMSKYWIAKKPIAAPTDNLSKQDLTHAAES